MASALLLGSLLHIFLFARAGYIGPPLVLNPDCVLDANWLLPTDNPCATAPEGLVKCCNCVYDETFWLNTLKVAEVRVDYEEKLLLGTWEGGKAPTEPLTYDRESLNVPMEADKAVEIRSRTTGWRTIAFMCRIILPDGDMDKVLPLVESKRKSYPRDSITMIVHCPVTEGFVRLESKSKRKFGPMNASGESDTIVVSGHCIPTANSRKNVDPNTMPQKLRVGYEETKPRRRRKKSRETHVEVRPTSRQHCTGFPRSSFPFAQQDIGFTALTTSSISKSGILGQDPSRFRTTRDSIYINTVAADASARDSSIRPVPMDSITIRLSTVSTPTILRQRDYIIGQAFGSSQVSTGVRDWSMFGGGTREVRIQACVSNVSRDADLSLSTTLEDRNKEQD